MTKIIQKKFQGTVPENKILDTYSGSQTDTYSCNYVNKLKNYTTEEQVVGYYGDKKLYRKKIDSTVGNIQSLLRSFNAEIWVNFCLKARSTDNIDFIIPSQYTSDANYNIDVYFSGGYSPNIRFGGKYINSGIVYGYVEYTKTTD